MAGNNLNQMVLDALRQAGGSAAPTPDVQTILQDLAPQSGTSFSSALADASRQIDALRSANQALAEVVKNNTQALTQNSASQGSKNTASTIGNVASSIFGSGLGLAPLVSTIARLFTGGKSEAPAPLISYVAPAPLRFDLADTSAGRSGVAGFSEVSYGQNGLPRQAAAAQVTAPSISIHVNALDSRSFMDHSNEIADAVRQAMLNMHPLNDVVSDL